MALVPARGGSKGLPGKNIKPLVGRPMLTYTIEGAREAPAIDRIVVSTDSEEIADVAREEGADVPFLRPAELGADHVTDLPVFQHALRWLDEHEGYRPDIIVHLRPTAPLRRAEHITAAVDRLLATGADSVRSICRAKQHPQKMWSLESGYLTPFIPPGDLVEPYNMPRQHLRSAYVQNGSVDVMWRRTIVEKGSMSGDRIAALEMDPGDSVNVDDELDFLAAERNPRHRSGSHSLHQRTRRLRVGNAGARGRGRSSGAQARRLVPDHPYRPSFQSLAGHHNVARAARIRVRSDRVQQTPGAVLHRRSRDPFRWRLAGADAPPRTTVNPLG
jgi:CMP-N,N'-diacetyllegionaminic acid synthase